MIFFIWKIIFRELNKNICEYKGRTLEKIDIFNNISTLNLKFNATNRLVELHTLKARFTSHIFYIKVLHLFLFVFIIQYQTKVTKLFRPSGSLNVHIISSGAPNANQNSTIT